MHGYAERAGYQNTSLDDRSAWEAVAVAMARLRQSFYHGQYNRAPPLRSNGKRAPILTGNQCDGRHDSPQSARLPQHHLEIRCMRFALLKRVLPGVVLLCLVACEKPPTPVVAVPAPPPPPAPPVRRPMAAAWKFHSGEVCTASASSGALALDLTTSSSTLTLTARIGRSMPMPAGRSIAIEFAGTAGSWTVTGRKAASHRVVASEPMTEDQAGQILVLLEGGVVRVGRAGEGLPPLQVPNSGVPGRDWFECVRRQLFP